MVIADANTTREKLDTQKKSLEELYSKTKAMESRLDEQNKEIDKTIEKSSQMEASISTAQSVIAKLDHETQVADEKLKLLDEKTTGISRLADGRLKIGGMIAGESSLLEEQGEKIINALHAKIGRHALSNLESLSK